ncbi:MAG: isoaspartyl peptidase/L-asparaginase family protein [Thermoanaerobaculia bacterium]
MTAISPTSRRRIPSVLATLLTLAGCAGQAAEAPPTVLVIHGGAGTITRAEMSPDREAAYRAALTRALESGHRILAAGGGGLDAVEATIRVMEDSPLFNAGRGAVFTAAGRNELDASIMDGASGMAGAVAGVTVVKNPISAARAVMEETRHVLLVAGGADAFAAEAGLETVEPGYFFTQRRWDALQRRRLDEGLEALPAPAAADPPLVGPPYGTVGALALDSDGRLAAGTSTGGMTFKRFGRVGDSPIIGAGTWADERCAVSGTGQGEYFIRLNTARDVCTRLGYLELSLAEAAEQAIHGALSDAGGSGGVIALDVDGNVAMPFNTEGMYRGWIGADGVAHVSIYDDEE